MVQIVGTPAVTQITTTTAVVAWNTDVASDSQVEYGLTSAYGSATAVDPAGVTAHSRTITGLTAGTTYHFRVRSAEATTSSDPAAISGVAARWRAADLTGLSANDPVALWASGIGGLVAAQPVAADRPLYVPSAQGGKAGLQFNGVSAHLNAGDVLKLTGALTAQFVLKVNDANDYSMVFTKSTGTNAADIQYEVRRSAGTNALQFTAGPGGTLQAADSGTVTLTAYHVYTVVANPAGTAQWYVDGVASGSALTWSPSGTWTNTAIDFLIGARKTPAGVVQPHSAPMTLLELNLYSVALDAATRHGSELFLGAFYGVSVT